MPPPHEEVWKTMFDAAKSVMRERRISEYVSAGEVGAAILSKSGKIYTGVCVDTCSTLGMLAGLVIGLCIEKKKNDDEE